MKRSLGGGGGDKVRSRVLYVKLSFTQEDISGKYVLINYI